MDGNNRWSKKKYISQYKSYKSGARKLIKLANFIFSKYDTSFISAFALSKNNLDRSVKIINLIKNVLNEALENYNYLDHNFDIRFIGDLSFLNSSTIKKIKLLNNQNYHKSKLLIFFNYSGKDDILRAAKKYKSKSIDFEELLYTQSIPDPEILIRTGGYSRISNFMLYQLAFTELFFLKKLWPEITTVDIKKIIHKYKKIDRKFGL